MMTALILTDYLIKFLDRFFFDFFLKKCYATTSKHSPIRYVFLFIFGIFLCLCRLCNCSYISLPFIMLFFNICYFYFPFKQMIERLNRTYKSSYRLTNGFDNYDGANYDLALWVAYYNLLRPHKIHNYRRPLVENDIISNGGNMPGKWQLMIFLGQQTILEMQKEKSA